MHFGYSLGGMSVYCIKFHSEITNMINQLSFPTVQLTQSCMICIMLCLQIEIIIDNVSMQKKFKCYSIPTYSLYVNSPKIKYRL